MYLCNQVQILAAPFILSLMYDRYTKPPSWRNLAKCPRLHWTHHSEETAVSLIAPRLNLHEPLAACATSRTYAGVEGAWRACGVIERAWYNYAIQSLDPEESYTAAHAEDEGYSYEPPPFRFWVSPAVWAPSR